MILVLLWRIPAHGNVGYNEPIELSELSNHVSTKASPKKGLGLEFQAAALVGTVVRNTCFGTPQIQHKQTERLHKFQANNLNAGYRQLEQCVQMHAAVKSWYAHVARAVMNGVDSTCSCKSLTPRWFIRAPAPTFMSYSHSSVSKLATTSSSGVWSTMLTSTLRNDTLVRIARPASWPTDAQYCSSARMLAASDDGAGEITIIRSALPACVPDSPACDIRTVERTS